MTEPQKKNPLGPTGRAVADNIKRLRGEMQYVKLAAILEKLGRPIPTLGLRKIESYERRVDADDLVALAVALDVSPLTLLMPPSGSRTEKVSSPAGGTTAALILWKWLRGTYPLPDTCSAQEFVPRSQPTWAVDVQVTETGSPNGDD
ncbi:helix-turn-helix transcriptional regulator [Mycobacterium sp. ENV421]|uniref:helix-turn-helix domain-containing protein n=1 Tax=Mycobacterium sp. ENV421 TaxID=1213407 RepID=UPI001E37C052|nr:helix-turn-helix transcriptional regulator [Mycobacterium sp. ENV421]